MNRHFLFSATGIVLFGNLFFTTLSSCNNTTNETEKNDSLEVLIPDMHNANNSLDWAGAYQGLLPCADCEGIAVLLEINQDNSFKKSVTYNNKSNTFFADSGRVFWDSTGTIITLKNRDGEKYKVEENQLRMLNKQGKPDTGKLAQHYILKKK